jgi:nucleoside-diphosphate-sugar epimerase
MNINITGATGLVGVAAVSALEREGHTVVRMQRIGGRAGAITFDLRSAISGEAFQNCEVLIHCAYDKSARTLKEVRACNVDASIRLFDKARSVGVRRFIFISSISAFEGCRSVYGRGKLEVERHVQALGGTVIRPGLVYGDENLGMVPTLARLARKLPLVPVFDGGRQPFYLIHRDDLAGVIAKVTSYPDDTLSSAVITVGHPAPVQFHELLAMLAESGGSSARFISVPGIAALLGLRLIEMAGLHLPFTSDNLMGMLYYNATPDFTWRAQLGVTTRDFQDFLSSTQQGFQ